MKRILIAMLCMLCLCLLSACGNSGTASETAGAQEPAAEEPADGYDQIGGSWEVGAIIYRNKVVELHEYPDLEDLYDTTFLTFDEDGSFNYLLNVWNHTGAYTRLSSDSFLLKTERVYRLSNDNGKLVEVESTSDSHANYIISLDKLNGEECLYFSEYDSITGKAKANEDPLIFVRPGKDSGDIYFE